jgi:hypothetical protein
MSRSTLKHLYCILTGGSYWESTKSPRVRDRMKDIKILEILRVVLCHFG